MVDCCSEAFLRLVYSFLWLEDEAVLNYSDTFKIQNLKTLCRALRSKYSSNFLIIQLNVECYQKQPNFCYIPFSSSQNLMLHMFKVLLVY